MATQEERRTTTRTAIVTTARALFAEQGYAATSVADILGHAGISRGAMYHHFAGKDDVFAAVFLATSADAIRTAARHVPSGATPLDALIGGCLGWLDAATHPDVARILLADGSAALGWERCRTLEEATSLGVMRTAITAAVQSGEIQVDSIDLVARLINAVLAEAALDLQRKPGRRRRRDTAAAVSAMIRGFETTRR